MESPNFITLSGNVTVSAESINPDGLKIESEHLEPGGKFCLKVCDKSSVNFNAFELGEVLKVEDAEHFMSRQKGKPKDEVSTIKGLMLSHPITVKVPEGVSIKTAVENLAVWAYWRADGFHPVNITCVLYDDNFNVYSSNTLKSDEAR